METKTEDPHFNVTALADYISHACDKAEECKSRFFSLASSGPSRGRVTLQRLKLLSPSIHVEKDQSNHHHPRAEKANIGN